MLYIVRRLRDPQHRHNGQADKTGTTFEHTSLGTDRVRRPCTAHCSKHLSKFLDGRHRTVCTQVLRSHLASAALCDLRSVLLRIRRRKMPQQRKLTLPRSRRRILVLDCRRTFPGRSLCMTCLSFHHCWHQTSRGYTGRTFQPHRSPRRCCSGPLGKERTATSR